VSNYGETMALALALGLVVVMAGFGVFIAAVGIRHREEGRGVVAWSLSYAGFNIAVAAVVVVGVWLPSGKHYAVAAFGIALLAKLVARRRLREDGLHAQH
jgi:uncharacterized membrane protein